MSVLRLAGDSPRPEVGFEQFLDRVKARLRRNLGRERFNRLLDDPNAHLDVPWYAPGWHTYLRSVKDSNADGIGDLEGAGLILWYLRLCGFRVIMLGPICAYAGKDGPYSVIDYLSVAPELGTVEGLRRFCALAHALGIRVVIDLVASHTSDRHPWFQEALRNPNSPERAMYHMYSAEERARFSEVKPGFADFYDTIWRSYPAVGFPDGVAWVMFLFHDDQPALRVFESEDVQRRMEEVMDFYVALGVDGFRLDAAFRYRIEPGSNGDNVPGSMEVVARWERHLRARWGRAIVLIAESTGDPAPWFEQGVHSMYHFAEMVAAFHVFVARNWSTYVSVMLGEPPVPAGARRAVFRRNHDEVNFDAATSQQMIEDLLARLGGPSGRNRLFTGVRNRLADLADGDPDAIFMLLALPILRLGWAWCYQGDEFGMPGELLAGRTGNRTPVQYTPGRFAGFSSVEPWLAVAAGHEWCNAYDALADPSSVLNRLSNLLHFWLSEPVLQEGEELLLACPDPSVLAFVRFVPSGEALLCLVSALPFKQTVYMNLTDWGGGEKVRFDLDRYGVSLMRLKR